MSEERPAAFDRAGSRGGPPRPALIGLGVLAAVAGVLLAIVLLQREPAPVGEASPSISPSTPSTAEPTEAIPSATASTTPESSPPAGASLPASWTEVALFSESGKRYVLGDLVAWSGGLVAVGTLYEDEVRNIFGPPPARAGVVWRSADGTSWTDATPAATFADVELAHLFETADGALVVIGHQYPGLEAMSAAWETLDGQTWSPIELTGMANGAFVAQVASGAQGHIASTFVGADSAPRYSADGRTWQPTLSTGVSIRMVAAGDEGFVSSTFGDDPAQTFPHVVASGDGLAWFDATEPAEGEFLPVPRGGDWVATTAMPDLNGPSVAVATWQSANGLEWSSLGEMALAEDLLGLGCVETPLILHGLPNMLVAGTVLYFGCGEGAYVVAGASYASLDGAAWEPLPFGDQAFAAGAAMIGDRVIIGTDTRTASAPVIGVTFWISEP